MFITWLSLFSELIEVQLPRVECRVGEQTFHAQVPRWAPRCLALPPQEPAQRRIRA